MCPPRVWHDHFLAPPEIGPTHGRPLHSEVAQILQMSFIGSKDSLFQRPVKIKALKYFGAVHLGQRDVEFKN